MCWRHFLQLRHARQFWIGVLIYILSFLLVAVAGIRTSAGGPALGYDCAWTTLLYSWELIKWVLDGMSWIPARLELFSLAVSGLINILFLVFIALALSGRVDSVRKVLRVAILPLFPFCWIVFHDEHLLPREGYFLWVTGMLLALFSNRNTSKEKIGPD